MTLPYRAELQGLRAIAVLLVFASHAGIPWFSGGFVGVDIFYVLSGYLISGILAKEFSESGSISVLNFYGRRLRRLLPALLVMICLTFVAALALLSGFEARNLLGSILYATTWTSNFYFAYVGVDYFNEFSSRDLYLHTWSLGVEEQFYLVWPLILFLLLKRARPGMEGPEGHRAFCRRILCFMVLMGLGLSVYLTYAYPKAGFYLMPSRIWQLAAGALLNFLVTPNPARSRLHRWMRMSPQVIGAMGIVLILASALLLGPNAPYPGWRAVAPSLGTVLVIAAIRRISGKPSMISHPILVWMGDRSYSFYLWHWPVLVLGFALGAKANTWHMAGLMGMMLVLAMLSYRYVELPFWKGRWSQVRARSVILIALGSTCVVMTVVLSRLMDESVDGKRERIGVQSRVDVPVIYNMGCDSWYVSDQVAPCVFGDPAAKKTVVLLGDSVLAQWFSAVSEVFPAANWRIVVLTKSACPMVDKDFFYPRIGKTYTVCSSWRAGVLDEIDHFRPDVVIVGSNSSYEFGAEEWIDGSRQVLARLSNAASKVYVITGTPSLAFDGPECLVRNMDEKGHLPEGACVSHGRFDRVDNVKEFLVSASGSFHNVDILDLNDLVCPEKICQAIDRDGQVVFRDSKHLTDSFVRSRIGEIRDRLIRLGLTGI